MARSEFPDTYNEMLGSGRINRYLRADTNNTLLLASLGILTCGGLLFFISYFLVMFSKIGAFDWYLFVGAAQNYIDTGEIYSRNIGAYGPSAEVYKYPPLLASIFVVLKNLDLSERLLSAISALVILISVFGSLTVCMLKLWQSRPLPAHFMMLIFVFTFEPVIENLVRLQLEPFILLLLVLSMYALCHRRDFLSGVLVGLAAALKVYPIFFLVVFLLEKSQRGISGVFVGIIVSLIFSIATVGTEEHIFYFAQILPMLLQEDIWIGPYHESISLGAVLLAAGAQQSLAQFASVLGLGLGIGGLYFLQQKGAHTGMQDRIVLWYAGLVCLYLLCGKNPWWNYQLLLLLPVVCLIGRLDFKGGADWVTITIILLAGLFIYWAVDTKVSPRLDHVRQLSDTLVPEWGLRESVLSSALHLRFLATLLVMVAVARAWTRGAGQPAG